MKLQHVEKNYRGHDDCHVGFCHSIHGRADNWGCQLDLFCQMCCKTDLQIWVCQLAVCPEVLNLGTANLTNAIKVETGPPHAHQS